MTQKERKTRKQEASATFSPRHRARQVAKTRSSRVDSVHVVANSYCLRCYGVGYSGGVPQRLSLRGAHVWIVPIVLTSPGYGVVGEVGLVAVDAATHEILGATPPDQVRSAGSGLAQEKKDVLQAAFHRARKA